MDYSKRQMTLSPNMQLVDIHIFVNSETIKLNELLNLISKLSSKISDKNHKKISQGIGNLISPTGGCRINNKSVNEEIAKQIFNFEIKNNCKWQILDQFQKLLFELKDFEKIRSDS